MGACARNMQSDSAEIKPAQCCIKLVFHLTYTMMHGSTKLKSCLLVGRCPGWMMFFFRGPLRLSRNLQWYSSWSTFWSPCLQTHVALSNSSNRRRQALVFPCPVVIAATLGVTPIFMLSLSWTVGKYSLVIAAFVHFPPFFLPLLFVFFF